MASKRYKKLPEKTKDLTAETIDNLLPTIKKNCTPKFDESLDLVSSQTTPTLIFLPVPSGILTTVLKFISPFFCLLFICKLKSIDSSNFVVQFFFTVGINFSIKVGSIRVVLIGSFLNLFEVISL